MARTARAARVTALAIGFLTAVCVGTPTARAHVHVSSTDAVRDEMAVVTFQVPNESETGSATTAVTVKLPNATSVYVESKQGWTTKLNRDTSAGTVRSVTWTANGSGIGADEFGLFRVSMKLPDADAVSFPATQQYADGTVVVWDQDPLPDGDEPPHPAAILELLPLEVDPVEPTRDWRTLATDNAALLAGVALLVSGLALGVAIGRKRT